MRVVITGAAGYVGWSVLNVLVNSPSVNEIIVYDNFSRRNYGLLLAAKGDNYRKVTVTVDELLNSRGLQKAVAGADCVCHLAALAPSPYKDDAPHTFDQVNHWGTAEVCYAVEDARVPRLVYVSSGAIYGFPDHVATVSTEPMPVNAYGASKLAGERHVDRLADRCTKIVLRAGTVFGMNPVARFDTFVNCFALDAALGRPLHVHGSGEQVRPIVHVTSLAEAIAESVVGDVKPGTYNVVERNVSVNETVDVLRDTSPSVEVIHTNQQARLNDLQVEPSTAHCLLPRGRRILEQEIPRMLDAISLT